ncbi:MAG: ABC transporter permease subunit, partial [Gemmatimonadaceae bacterium]|nr:ABC transporter permease subunit [Gemmatimonadaceae bacterium]
MMASRPSRRETLAIVVLAAMVAAVVLVPALAASDPLRIDDMLARRIVAPLSRDAHGTLHLLGTDRFGRDLLVRMLLAGRLSLTVGVIGSVASGALGVVLGTLAAWRGGLPDRAITGAADVLLALPRLVLLLVGVALWQPGLGTIVVVIVATGWMGTARLVRAESIGVLARPYVAAATSLGAG